MAKNVIDQVLENIFGPWQNYKGRRVREAIQKALKDDDMLIQQLQSGKGSYMVYLGTDAATNIATVALFASAETYGIYKADPDSHADLILSSVEIPLGTGGGSAEASTIVKLTNMGAKSITATKDSDLVAKIRFTSQLYDPSVPGGSVSDTNEEGTLLIETRMQNASEWKVAANIAINSQEAANTSAYTEINLAPYCVDGTQSVRMIATGTSSHKSTPYVIITVTKTNIQIKFQTKWQNPFEYKAVALTISVPLTITGTISKVLHLKVSSSDGKYSRTYDYSIGTATYTETPYIAYIDHPKAHGIYNIEAWITSGDNVKTESVSQNIMCTLSGNTTPLLVLNNIGTFQNWSSVQAFDYAVFNPKADNTDIAFVLTNLESNSVIYSESVQNVPAGVIKSLIFDLEVETEDNVNFPASMSFTSGQVVLRDPLRVVVDNSENFAPTSGADFFLNPKKRNNSESEPNTIVNAVNNQQVKSTFEGFSFISDGWIVDANTNARCLRVLDGSKVNINYDAYSDDTPLQGLTIEIDFATRNVTDENGILFQMGTPSTVDNHLVGFWLKAQESCMMTMEKRVEGSQNWIYSKETRTHVAINIVPNLYSQGVNYVRVFINGIISREFVYSDNDAFWHSVSGIKKTGGIVIAPQGSDIDIYGLRIYKKSLSATDIRQNRLSSFATIGEKKAFKEKNDILGESGLISYSKAYTKYNTLLYKCAVPSLKSPTAVVGDIVIHKINDKAHSGTLYNMSLKGQGSTSKKYWAWNIQSDFKREDSKWVDENLVDHGQCYQNADGLPLAKKLVDKRNWASSPQSHKMGATKLYNDLYKEVVGKNEITSIEGMENCRVAVYEDPFLVFQQTENDSEPVFIGLGTFGSGKADKPTFGYDKTKTPDMLMIEGSDNNPRLTKHQVPWIPGDVNYSEEEEGYVYAGTTSWDYDLGNRNSISRFIEAFNFVYSHTNRLKPFNGTFTQLKEAKGLDISYCYWVTKAETGSERYDMYRYDEINKTWVAGGTTKSEAGVYATLNVKTQTANYISDDFTNHETYLEWEKVNEDFIAARRKEFAEKITTYLHKKDILFFICMMKLLAACDNRAKNTYLWVFSSTSLIRAFQDDLDSILPFDNQGKLTKPYWVEEHDFDTSLGKNYWNGEDNALYNLLEECFPTDLRSTMKEILSAMTRLGDGTVQGCWEKYFMSTCQYFPAVAYNEFARIGYEYAHYQMVNGNYNNDTDPITQSLGSQEEGERQWCKDRTIYMSSYAKYGEFDPGSPLGGNINYRSTEQMEVKFNLTAAMWIYPVVTIGQSTILDGKRVKAGESVTATGVTDSNTQNIVCGVNYMSDIGTWYDKPANETFAFNGSRVRKLIAGTDNKSEIHLKATSLLVGSMKSLRTLDIHNLSTVSGSMDVSANVRLGSLDARGTSITGVSLPNQEFLKSVKLPATMTALRLENFKGLSELTLEGWEKLETFYMDQKTCPNLNSLIFIEKLKNAKGLNSVTILGVNWADITIETLTWLLDRQVKITGRIAMNSDEKIDATLKMRIVSVYGNVDDESNSLYISYNKVAINTLSLYVEEYMSKTGDYQVKFKANPITGNNLVSVSWSISNNDFATINKNTGIVTVNKIGTAESNDSATVTATVVLSDNSVKSDSIEVYFYERVCKIGDFVFADGTTGDTIKDNKTWIGVCFYIDPENPKCRLMVSNRNLTTDCWGLYNSNSTDGLANIELADSSEVVYDIVDIPNILNLPNVNNYIPDINNVIDLSQPDGYAKFTDVRSTIGFTTLNSTQYNRIKNYLDNYKENDSIPTGLLYTLFIIRHRDIILSDSNINLDIPIKNADTTEMDSLKELINKVVVDNANKKYKQYYYPAASYCYHYEPTISKNEKLLEKFKAHNWFLPTIGDLYRLLFYNNQTSGKYNAFAKARLFSSIFSNIGACWSCQEYSELVAWINEPTRIVNNNNNTNRKSNTFVIRPVCAF